ncbi:serine/threonine-protein kinase [Fontimonas sp. SYSU GA230001]|uniref:serine/threonine-protein kinase n=1 Tax=Fontimonas sp. SYSU GA230001 TaxID=3142450 RepID=UPI0032B553F5
MPHAGDILGNYRIVRLLGSGGFADVYEAEDPLLQRSVALKVLLAEVGRTPDMLARFQREVRAVAALNHPGIVPIYSVGETDGANYYAMRLLPGGDLRRRIGTALPPRRALEILLALAAALDHAHQQGIVHRDIKPENILFDEDDQPVLTDFGIAKVLRAQEQLTAIGTAMGTPRYLSPEQARGSAVDARTDLYSLGVILFEMLTGQAPYDGADPLSVVLKHATEPIPRLPESLAALQPLVDQLMAKHPGQRPASAAETEQLIRRELRQFGGGTPPPVRAVPAAAAASTPPPPPRPEPLPAAPAAAPSPVPREAPAAETPRSDARRRTLWPLALAPLLLLLAGLAVWLWPVREAAPPPLAKASPADLAADANQAAATESRAERIARERKRCALHVSALTADGNLVYDDALRFPGARREADGSGIRVPQVQLANGQWVNALVTPQGCVLIRSLAAAPASGKAN